MPLEPTVREVWEIAVLTMSDEELQVWLEQELDPRVRMIILREWDKRGYQNTTIYEGTTDTSPDYDSVDGDWWNPETDDNPDAGEIGSAESFEPGAPKRLRYYLFPQRR